MILRHYKVVVPEYQLTGRNITGFQGNTTWYRDDIKWYPQRVQVL